MRACLFVALAFSGVLQPREPSLKIVLARAGDYVSSYHLSMTTVIAEERYAQTLVTRTGESADETTRRTLLSDFVIVNTDGDQPWMAFRDVLEVDGKPARDRDNRMQRLFSAGADIDRAMAINRESARYNLGTIVRTINTPTVALDFLLPDTQRRFKFHRSDNRPDAGGGAWEIDFSEREHPTIIRTPGGRDVAARGSVVVDPSDGRIARTTLNLMGMRATIVVEYAVEPRLHVSVPVRMTESYQMAQETLDAVATYSNYRRFETGVRIIPR